MTEHTSIERAVAHLAALCDGAVAPDGQGFNGADTGYGRSLARQLSAGKRLTPLQTIAASRMLRRYHGQLAAAGIEIDQADETTAKAAQVTRDTESSKIAVQLGLVTNEARIKVWTPYALKDAIKTLPGARWSKDDRCWHLPATPSGAESIARMAREQHAQIDTSHTTAAPYAELLERARAAYRLQAQRTLGDDDLPAMPIKMAPGWTHQRQAYAFVRGLDAGMLAMDMGTGKSATTIGLLTYWQPRTVLILCPKSVMNVWPKQFGIHAQRPDLWHVVVAKGSGKQRAAQLRAEAARAHGGGLKFVYVINYDSAWRDGVDDALLGTNWDVIVADESHRIKSPGAISSRFAHKLGLRAKRRLCLTGTPMPHNPLDIYGQYRFLDPGILGTSFARFRNRYAIMGGYEGREIVGMNPDRADELARRFGSIAYQCKADDVLDLPEALEVTRTTILEPAAARAYKQMEQNLVAETDAGIVTAASAGVAVLRLQQITGGRVPTEDALDNTEQTVISTAKRELLADVLQDAPTDRPVVVFCRFRADLDTVAEVAEQLGREYRELSGRRRDALGPDAAMAQGFHGIAGVQIQAGGVGIDLTAASLAIYYSVGHSLGDYLQSMARLHRPGQKHNVLYVHLVCEGTIDETVYRALAARQAVVEAVLAEAKKRG